MTKILITGKDSYIGTSFESLMSRYDEDYQIETLDMKDETWRTHDFSPYDVVFHVAGIAHIKETAKNRDLYYKVNRDLAYETAKRAKEGGVAQFIFLSSMSVYGIETGVINKETLPAPKNAYGKSKLEAEELIRGLEEEAFTVAILRPPMVYGQNCPGNYTRLVKLAKKTPIFPDIENKRSMVYIDNLSEFVKLLIDNGSSGFFFPQNAEYVNTTEMVKEIAEAHGKQIRTTKLFNPFLKLMLGKISVVDKVFGDLVYTYEELNSTVIGYKAVDLNYQMSNFRKNIKDTAYEK